MSRRAFVVLFSVLVSPLSLVGCPDDELNGTSGDAGKEGPTGAGDAGAGDTLADGGEDGAGDAGAPGGGADAGGSDVGAPDGGAPGVDAGAPADDSFRFIALGDSGKGNDGQRLVADAMLDVCTERGGCDFALMLGDNIYNSGVEDVDDAQWQEKFEIPYAALDFPFFSTLGNHDYGAPAIASFLGGIGIDPRRGQAQVDYTGVSQKFVMPDSHYVFEHGPLELVSLNTTSVFWADFGFIADSLGFSDENDRMFENLSAWEAASTQPWRIAFGHHPYLSNGPHGNAGIYDGVFIDGLIGSGTELKEFFEEHVIGRFDVFLCGHDHSLQDLGTVGGTDLFVSGGGASHTDLEGGNEVVWQADRRGFLLVEGDSEEITFTFVLVPDEEDGSSEPWMYAHSRTITREE